MPTRAAPLAVLLALFLGAPASAREIAHAESDGEGVFSLYIEARGPHILAVRHPDYHEAVRAGVIPGRETRIS